MTQHASEPPLPGRLLLRLARLIFDPAVIDDVVQPTIADLQREFRDAGTDGRRRLRARWRGYRAFWMLALLSPVAFVRWTRAGHQTGSFPEVADRIAFSLIGTTVIASVLIVAGRWALVPAVASAVVAMALHAWWRRHPSHVALPDHTRDPQINLSAIPVGGDIGGLIFVVGSVLIVTAAIPMVRWFLVGVVVGGFALAFVLARWHAAHPSRPTGTSIVAR